MRSRSRDGLVRPSRTHVSLARTFALAQEIRRDSRDRSRFSRRRRRAFHCSSSRVPVPPAAPCRKPERLEAAGENAACVHGVHGSGAKKEKSRRELSSFLPIVSLLSQRPCRFARRRSHAATECRFFPLFPGSFLVRGLAFSTGDVPVISMSRAEAPPFFRRAHVHTTVMRAKLSAWTRGRSLDSFRSPRLSSSFARGLIAPRSAKVLPYR